MNSRENEEYVKDKSFILTQSYRLQRYHLDEDLVRNLDSDFFTVPFIVSGDRYLFDTIDKPILLDLCVNKVDDRNNCYRQYISGCVDL